jgi:hypothetical protein
LLAKSTSASIKTSLESFESGAINICFNPTPRLITSPDFLQIIVVLDISANLPFASNSTETTIGVFKEGRTLPL